MWCVRRRSRCCHVSAHLTLRLRNRRVGTEAYAPPEIFFPGADGYDATKYDVWSLGIILFLMLCIDALDIIQIPEMSTGARRTTLRMPFLSYANVIYPLRGNATGACGNLTNQLDDPPASAFAFAASAASCLRAGAHAACGRLHGAADAGCAHARPLLAPLSGTCRSLSGPTLPPLTPRATAGRAGAAVAVGQGLDQPHAGTCAGGAHLPSPVLTPFATPQRHE